MPKSYARASYRGAIMLVSLLCVIVASACGSARPSATHATPTATTKPKATPTRAPSPSAQPTLAGWRLIFDDEFTDTQPDPQRWSVANSASGGYTGCCFEFGQEFWSPTNVVVNDGQLHILTTGQAQEGYPFTSGALTTEHTFQFTYGRIDIRARLPGTMGLWPAFWLLPLGVPVGGTAPYELDFLEAWGGNTHEVNAFFHWADSQVQCTAKGPDYSAGYHVYTLLWSPGRLEWQVDGAKQCVDTIHVPGIPMYLLLDTAIDGRVQRVDGSTRLPQTTSLDYVRIWQPA